MAVCRIFMLLALACTVLSDGGVPFNPCYKDDLKCLSKATEDFLMKTYNGSPGTEIKPLDPLVVPELSVVVDQAMGLVFEFKNLNITGMKNQQVSDFTMDTAKKSVVLRTKVNLNVVSDLVIKFTKKNKEFNGLYTASTNAVGTSQYGYSFIMKNDQEFFEVGPEINTCEIIGEPNVTISDVLQNALDNDSDARDLKEPYEANKVNLRKRTLCQIVETAYATGIHNLRAAARIFPKSAFFKDI